MLDKIFIDKINKILEKDIVTNSLTEQKIIDIEKNIIYFFLKNIKSFY